VRTCASEYDGRTERQYVCSRSFQADSNYIDNDVGDIELSTNDNQIFPMCENTLSMCQENIYKNDSEYRLDFSNDEIKIVTNQRIKKSNKVKANTIVNLHIF
jgi:hypothetical protein